MCALQLDLPDSRVRRLGGPHHIAQGARRGNERFHVGRPARPFPHPSGRRDRRVHRVRPQSFCVLGVRLVPQGVARAYGTLYCTRYTCTVV